MIDLELKRHIFELFENTRILFNDYYNGKEEYTEDCLKEIYKLTSNAINCIIDIENILNDYLDLK